MDRDGVATEGVEDKHVEILRRVLFHREASVAKHDIDLGFGVADIMESGSGQPFYLGVDLVDAIVVARPGVGCQCARAQANDADAPLRRQRI